MVKRLLLPTPRRASQTVHLPLLHPDPYVYNAATSADHTSVHTQSICTVHFSPLYDGERPEYIITLHWSPAVHPQRVDDVGRAVGVGRGHATLHEPQRPQQGRVSIPGDRQAGSGQVAGSGRVKSGREDQVGSGWVD